MRRSHTRRNITIGLLISLVFVSFFAFYSFRNMTKVMRERKTIDATLQSLRALENVMDDIQDMETGQRGFLIAGKEDFLDPYKSAKKRMEVDSVELKALYPIYPDRKAEFEKLLQLVGKKIQRAEASIRIVNSPGRDSALAMIQSGEGKLMMDSIRQIITGFENTDRDILREANVKRGIAARATARLFIALAAIFLIGLVIVFWRIMSGLKQREKYQRQIAYLAGLTERTSDAIISTDTGMLIRSWNQASADIYGFTPEEAIGQPVGRLLKIDPEQEQAIREKRELLENGNYKSEYAARKKSGELVYIQASVSVLRDAEEQVEGYVAIHREINEKEKSEPLLEQFNAELSRQVEEKTTMVQDVLERISDGFCSMDEHWNFTYINNTGAQLLGLQPSDIIGKNLWKVFPEEAGNPVYQAFHQAFERQQYSQDEYYYPPFGKWFLVHIYPSPNGTSVFFQDITGIKRTEADLLHSNERFEMITSTTNDAIWEWNLETGDIWGNETHQQLYGLTVNDPVPGEAEWVMRIHPDDRPGMIRKQEDTLASSTNVFITEYRFNTEQHGYKNIYDRCYIVRNAEGKAIRMLGSMMDVTESKKAQEALQQSEEKYRSMIEQASDGIFIMDEEGRYLDVNPAACTMLGYTKAELVAMSAADVLSEGEIPMPKLKSMELRSGQTIVMDRRLKKKDGIKIDTEVSYKMLSKGNILAIARDITEKKKADEAVRISEETRKLIMNSALDAIVCIDMTGSITVWTPQAEKIFGWNEQETIGKKLTQTIIPERYHDRHQQGMKNYQATGKGPVLNRLTELTARHKEGKEFPIELSIIPIRQGETEFFCAFIRDITERKIAAEKIVREKELSDTAIDSLPGIFYIFDTDRKFLKWNKNFETVSGYDSTALRQIKPIDFFTVEERTLAIQAVEKVFTQGSAELEAHFLTRNGEKIPYFFTGRAINYEGKPCMLGTGIDIAELRRTQQNYASLVNGIDEIVWEADAQTLKVNFISQQAERLLGYPVERWINEPGFWAAHLHPDDRYRVLEFSDQSKQNKQAFEFEYRMIAANGNILWLRDIVTVIAEAGKPARLRGIMVDITEQKKSDEEIILSNARFQTISKATSDIVWDLDVAAGKIWWNDNYYSLLGIEKKNDQTPISDWYERIHPDDLHIVKKDMEKGVRDHLNFYSHEYRFARSDGSYLHFLDRTFIMRNQVGEAYRMIGSMVNMTPIHEARQVVAESENRLRTIIQSEPQCIKLLDQDGLLLEMNPAGLAMIEADSLEQVKGHPLYEVVDPEYRKPFRRLIDDVFRGKSASMPFGITGLKGTKRWLETHAVPMKNAAGEIVALLGVTIDITQKRKAEDELRKNEEKYRTLVEQAVDAIALYDASGKILDVNTGSVNLLGYTKEELLQLSLPDILTSEEITTKPVRYDVLLRGESTVKQRKMKKKDGSIVETEVRSQQLPDGRFLSVIRDLTERQKAQQQIEREKELSDKLIDSLPGVFYSYDEQGRFLRWNKQFEIVTGYSGKEIVKMRPTDFFEGEARSRMQEKINTVFSKGYSDTEEEFISKDGSRHPYYFKAHRIIIDGSPCLLGTGIDISDRKKAEQELDESYKAIRKLTRHLQNIREQERTHIAREIHDELGQQLTVLKMDVSWLNKKVASSDEMIKQKMKSLLSMLDDTVRSVRRISSELRPSLLDDLGLTAAMEWQLTEFEKRSGIHTRFINSGDEVLLPEAVKTALFRIFQESLTNVARHSQAKNISVSFIEADDHLVLSIQDDGKGFDKQQVADKKTLGILGMKERTFMIDGTYEIVSAPGKGTVVTVKIPFTHTTQPDSHDPDINSR